MAWFTCFGRKAESPTTRTIDIEEEISSIQNIRLYSYKELQIASNDFSVVNKIGRGGFGSVYKGKLKDGTLVALKVLSVESSQGVREFLTEINTISAIQHENLVSLCGCCVEGGHRIVVYGYLENNSLAQTLLGGVRSNIKFSWKIRTKICIGVALGLAFLHEEIQPHVVHRDIKASNVLLDKDLTAKISDFGLAKLFPPHLTHISTRVAGTLGYLAPEYALRGQLTRKADIYSFGVLLLEIVCGRCNKNDRLPAEEKYLLEKAWVLYSNNKLKELMDVSLEGDQDFDLDEACKFVKISFLCTQQMPKLRPSMSTVVKMLRGEIGVDEMKISQPGLVSEYFESKNTSDASSSGLGKQDNSTGDTTMTHGTMTFSSIYNRSP
ncbi:cold-responsive protein kinase 1-like isoform X2 [Apium graveolens]|uniref:cold-responsive protein kinase 1-like isoform X2 n=1 Tax=Apium graveolens TaxID=4045 RepID=UPI003D7A1C03